MNEQLEKEKSAVAANSTADRNTFLAEIERLYIAGHPTRRIAEMLGTDGYRVGRNLREIRKRWARAAARQRALAPTRCAVVYEQAMDGWQRSQQPKQTTTSHNPAKAENAKTVTRREEGPGDKTFLQAAVSSLMALRHFTAERQASSEAAKTRQMTDRECLIYLEFLTQEQVDILSNEQLRRMREAIDNLRAEIDAERRRKAGQEGDAADLPAADVPGRTDDSPPHEAGGNPAPVGDESVAAAEGLPAATPVAAV